MLKSFSTSFRCFSPIVAACAFVAIGTLWIHTASAAEQRVFEIRTYTTAEGKLDALHRRFREHTMKLFERHGMVNVAYWTPNDPALAHNTLIYVLSHRSRAAADDSWAAFRNDPEWQRVREASEADGKIVLKVESVFLTPTDYSPLQ